MKTIFANADAGMIGMMFFFLVFIGIATWVLSPSRKQQLESHKNIPISEDRS